MVRGQFRPQGHHMHKLGRSPLGDARYLISNLYAFQFQRRFLKLSSFVPMFHFMTPCGANFDPGASYEQTWWRSTRRCFNSNIKALCLPVSEKKNLEVFLFCSYVPICDPWDSASFDQGHHMNKLGRGLVEDATN